jgi:uncharacterized membrane protein
MSEAAYDAHSKGEMQGAHSRERVDRSLAEAAKKFPGLAKEIEKYTVALSNQNMICLVNHEDKKVIVAYRGTERSHHSDWVHNAAIFVNYVAAVSNLADRFNLPNRFNSALNFTQESVNRFPGY